ncbi:uncharacterized protein RG961_006327 isoform 4-T5 [Leptosomus discolor]
MEKEVTLSLLKSFLGKLGVNIGKKTLISLYTWGYVKGHFSDSSTLFDVSEWRRCGDSLWDAVIDKDRTAERLGAPWREVTNCLKKYKMELSVAAAAVRRLNAVDSSLVFTKPQMSPGSEVFPLAPPFFPPRWAVPCRGAERTAGGKAVTHIVTRQEERKGRCAPRRETTTESHPDQTQTASSGARGASAGTAPSEEEVRHHGADPIAVTRDSAENAEKLQEGVGKEKGQVREPVESRLYPDVTTTRLQGDSPGIMSKQKQKEELFDEVLQQLINKLSELNIAADSNKKNPENAATHNPFAVPSSLPVPLSQMPVPTTSFSNTLLNEQEAGRRWKGVICDALIEGNFLPSAFPIVTDQAGGRKWEPFDWKILEKARLAVSQYGLQSNYTQQLLQSIFAAGVLLPLDSQQIANILLSPSQQLMFSKAWQQLCDQEAARPRQQGDPLYGVQAQMLTGQGPFASVALQQGFIGEHKIMGVKMSEGYVSST